MTAYLLDVNVLIALVDPRHVQYGHAHDWFADRGRKGWATCPLTENGLIRIVGHPRYPNTPGSPAIVAGLLSIMRSLPHHAFWTDDVSLVASEDVDADVLHDPAHVTDTYLLALAKAHGGKLATLDRKLSPHAVRDGARALHVI